MKFICLNQDHPLLRFSKRGLLVWRTALLAGCWGIWLERNNHTFGGGFESSEDIWDKIRFGVAIWLFGIK